MIAEYRLRIPHETAELIKGLHPDLKRRVKSVLKSILQDPDTGKALKNELHGLRCFRIRRFRIVYRVSSGNMLEIVAIGSRKSIYEETFRLICREHRHGGG